MNHRQLQAQGVDSSKHQTELQSPSKHDSLVALLYQGVNSKEAFKEFFDALEEVYRCKMGGFLGYQTTPRTLVFGITFGYPEGFVDHFITQNLVDSDPMICKYFDNEAEQMLSLAEGDSACDVHTVLNNEDALAWVESMNIGDTAGLRLPITDHEGVIFNINRDYHDQNFSTQELEELQSLSTHIQQAMQLYVQMNRHRSEHLNFIEAFNHLATPTLLLNELSTVIVHNSAANQVLEKYQLWSIDGSRRLSFLQSPNETAFYQQLGQLSVAQANRAPSLLNIETKDLPLIFVLNPMFSETGRYHGAMIEIFDCNDNQPAAEAIIHGVITATPAEAKVASYLGHGYDIKSIAATLNRSEHTIRGYVKNLLKNNQLNRQSELVAIMVRISRL